MKRHESATLTANLLTRNSMMSTAEVMAFLGVTRHTLCAWVRASKIPAIRMPGNGYAFDPRALHQWIAQRAN